jgi:hypothetical protein
MINCIPDEILLNITLYLDKSEDLFEFLYGLKKHDRFDEICTYIFLYYIKKLDKYYRNTKKDSYNENDSAFYFYYYLSDISNNNLQKYSSSDDIPYDNNNKITCLYSEMIKEYSISINYPIQNNITFLIKSLTKSINVAYNEEKDITYLNFIK